MFFLEEINSLEIRMYYWKNIAQAVATTFRGLLLTFKYLIKARKPRKKVYLENENYFHETEGIFTVQFPHEEIPVPDRGRYQLHNKIEDCIVCDKCAKICPVDCIDIEPIRAKETFGYTSNGSPLKIYAAKFDIDMSKCCFCGLCTVVCPTECLTMTKEYDFSTSNILDHNFSFSKMTDSEIEEKKKEFEMFQVEKLAQKTAASLQTKKIRPTVRHKTDSKPVFKPRPIPKRK